ncbi:MAG TPA: asparagine synthase-related protein, partial [Ktedonobacteraceae bacterium]|nr:asparagine synthase-related protein [Ktedonobacteraceae bacterium]
VFIYQGVDHIAAGTVVIIDATTVQIAPLEQRKAEVPSKRVTLPELALLTREAMLEAAGFLAETGETIGILFSGGIDSAVVAAALVRKGARVIAYHLQHGHSSADESACAVAAAGALSIPLVLIPATTEADTLSFDWRFPHPYGHAGLRWMQSIAEHAVRDGISLLTTGRGGDLCFGPLDSYGLADIFSAPIAFSEKVKMCVGAVSTDWLLPDIVKSCGRSHSLISASSLAGTSDPFAVPPFLCQDLLRTPRTP